MMFDCIPVSIGGGVMFYLLAWYLYLLKFTVAQHDFNIRLCLVSYNSCSTCATTGKGTVYSSRIHSQCLVGFLSGYSSRISPNV